MQGAADRAAAGPNENPGALLVSWRQANKLGMLILLIRWIIVVTTAS